MDPQQELFTALLTQIKAKEYAVYDGFLPPEGTPYPFVYLAENRMKDSPNKSNILGTVYQTVHVWHSSPKKRGTVSEMLAEIKDICWHLHYTQTFAWNCWNVTQRILTDKSTKTPLLHGVLEVEFKLGGTRSEV